MLEVVTKNCGMALECISYESKKDLFESVPQGIPLWETKLQNGELLIIPSGWWHQAVNLGNTLAMVCVLSGSDLLISNWQQMRRKGKKKNDLESSVGKSKFTILPNEAKRNFSVGIRHTPYKIFEDLP